MIKSSLSLIGAVALAGCATGTQPPGPSTTRLFSTDAGTAINALGAGKTLTAQKGGVVALAQDFSAGTTAPVKVSFQMKQNANGQLSIIVDGVERAFTVADRSVEPSDGMTYGYFYQDTGAQVWVGMWNYQGTLDQALNPAATNYVQIWGFYADMTQSGFGTNGFAAVGTETTPAAVAALPGTATYSGRAGLNVFPATGYIDNTTSRTKFRGNLDMSVDFGSSTISGMVSNMTVGQPGQASTPFAGTLALDPTAITGNGFSGSMTPDASLLATIAGGATGTGTYGGAFYGPNADQLGGTMSFTGNAGGVGQNGIGYFWGDKN